MSGRGRRLGSAQARALLELLALAARQRRPERFVEAASRRWGGGRLSLAADAVAVALREGARPSEALDGFLDAALVASLRAGEESGDLSSALEQAGRQAERGARASRLLWAPAAHPLLVLSLCGFAMALLGGLAAPQLQALRVELAALAGRPAPGGLVALAAARPALSVLLGLSIGLAPLVLPLGAWFFARTEVGSSLWVRVPVLGTAARWRATADFAGSWSRLVRAGVPHGGAWKLAAAGVGVPALRHRLGRLAERAASGEPMAELLATAGLPEWRVRALTGERLRSDGGVAALRELAEEAGARHEQLLRLGGRGLAGALGVAGFLLAFALVSSGLLPLLAAGGA